MTYATAADVLTRWVGQGKPADTAQVAVLVADAETIIAGEFPDLATRAGTEGEVTAEQVKLVVVAMVTRLYKNPEGIRTRTDSTNDQFGGTVVFAGDNLGSLELSAGERALLSPSTTRFGGIGVLSTTRGDIETAPVSSCSEYGLPGTVENDAPYELWP